MICWHDDLVVFEEDAQANKKKTIQHEKNFK